MAYQARSIRSSDPYLPTWIKRLERLCVQWWWVLLCLLIVYTFHEQSAKTREEESARLRTQLIQLQGDKVSALMHHDDLMLQLNSQSDPEFVELVLRKGLGLVPQDQTKVFFDREE